MRKLILIPAISLLAAGVYMPLHPDSNLVSKKSTLNAAAPSMDLVDIQPVNSSGDVVYLACAPRTSHDKATAQLSVWFKIKNKEAKTINVTGISYSYTNNGQTVLKLFKPDPDKDGSVAVGAGKEFSWQNSRDYHEVDDAVFFNIPFPSSLTIKVSVEGFNSPYVINKPLKAYANQTPGNSYAFPGQEQDLRYGEYWYSYGGHGGGSQFFAYDFKVIGWDDENKKWDWKFPGKDGSKNEHYRAYGKPICAIADGEVIDFGDNVKENIGNGGGGSGGGNFFKINNGKETICYYHMQPGSLNKSLMKIGAKVKKGQMLGLLGNSGSSSEPHGHTQAILDADKDGDGPFRPLNFSSIYIIDKNEIKEPDPGADWAKVEDRGLPFLQDRRCMIWPSAAKPCWYPRGWVELGRHGIPESKYQEEFTKIWGCGYYPVWVDAYDVAGKTYFNTIFRYNKNNYDVAVRHDMTKESYQQEYEEWVKKKGYRLQQLDNYLDAGKLKFAAIFIKKDNAPQQQPSYHALSPEEHQKLFDKYTGDGFVPVNVSVTSVGGKRYYSAFYEKRNVGGCVLKSFLSQQEYQELFDDMDKKHWEQVYINAYHHDGQTRFSVIWYEKSGYQTYTATRKSTSDSYQEKYEDNLEKGLLTRCVTGYDEGGKHWFAAHWAK